MVSVNGAQPITLRTVFGRFLRHRSLLLLVAALAASVVLTPAASAQTEDEVKRANAERDAAYERLREVRRQVDSAFTVYEDLRDDIFEVEYDLDRLTSRIGRDELEAAQLQTEAENLIVQAYMNRTPEAVGIALDADSVQDFVTRQAILDRANDASVQALDRLLAVSRELERLSGRLDEDRSVLTGLENEAQAALDEVNLVLERAREEFDRNDAAAKEARKLWEAELARQRAEEERRRREAEANSGGTNGRVISGLRCPQAEPMWFRNDWGNPRSGGRTHKGTDIFGAKGGKVHAVTSGTLRTRTGGLGGTALWLFGDDGHWYYYAHLSGWASGVRTGSRVSRGSVIGFVGNTGNATGGAHHTHFEIHPNGGSAINPYWTLSKICNR